MEIEHVNGNVDENEPAHSVVIVKLLFGETIYHSGTYCLPPCDLWKQVIRLL